MVLYTLFRFHNVFGKQKVIEILVPDEQKTDRCRIPYRIYEAAKGRGFRRRPKKEFISIYRGTDLVHYGMVVNLESPEFIYKDYVKASLKREKDISSQKLKDEYKTFLCDQRVS